MRSSALRDRLRLVVTFWLVRLLLSAGVVAPIATVLGARVARFPQGDALLFEPGALFLTEVVRIARSELASAASSTVLLFGAASLAQVAAVAWLMSALAVSKERRPGAVAHHFSTFVLLWGLTLLAQAVIFVLSVMLGGSVGHAVSTSHGGRAGDLVLLAFAALGLLGAVLLGLVHDLARAARVSRDTDALRSLAVGLEVGLRSAWQVMLAWSWPTLLSLGCVLIAAAVAGAFHVERSGSARWIGVGVAHQAALLACCALRATWLHGAIRLVAMQLPPSVGRSASSDGLDDPRPGPVA